MANLEVIALDETTPQLRAPGAGDEYSFPRPVASIKVSGQTVLGSTGAPLDSYEQLDLVRAGDPYMFTRNTAAAGVGNGFYLDSYAKDNGGSERRIARIALATDATHATAPGGKVSLWVNATGGALTEGLRVSQDASVEVFGTLKAKGYTVATLPAAGTAGRRAYVTDATAPTFLGALTGGGAVVCPVFDNGSAWVAG